MQPDFPSIWLVTLPRRLSVSSFAGLCCCHLLHAQLAEAPDAQHINFPDTRLTVSGLAWFDEDTRELRRLPARLKDTFRPPVWSLAQQPSGGRIRFKTDSTKIAIVAQNPDTSTMHHMTTIGQSGFDLYVNGEYLNSAWPDKNGKIAKEWSVGAKREWRNITIYLPLYKGDAFISFVDGLEMLSREHADGLVDGVHANSIGFYFCAKGLEPHLRKALGLAAR